MKTLAARISLALTGAMLLIVCPAAQRAVTHTFTIQEPLSATWGPDRVNYKMEFPQGQLAPYGASLKDAAGTPVAVQLSDVVLWPGNNTVKSATVSFMVASLKPDEKKSWTLTGGTKPVGQPTGDLKIETGKDTIRIFNSAVGVRTVGGAQKFDAPARAEAVPAPIQGAMVQGKWDGSGWWITDTPCLGYRAKVVEKGPVFVRVAIRYDFAENTSYSATVELSAGQDVVVVSEQYDLSKGKKYEMPSLNGVKPGQKFEFALPTFANSDEALMWDWWQPTAYARLASPNCYNVTHLYLKPGEEIRTPLTAMLFWGGADTACAQNLWRRWMFTQNFPKEHGKPLSPRLAGFCGNYFQGYRTDQKGEIEFIDRYIEEGIKLDYWWMDAGWYPCDGNWCPVGTWEVDRERYPGGLLAISNHAHSKGMQLILWFEPERVTKGSWLALNHPEWVLGGKDGGLLNLGNPAAWMWLVDHMDKIIVGEGVDIYRQDFNMDPLGHWRANDPADRQGITEIKHVQGYLAYWDELQRRHPGMLIDSCASGGRRDDLETMRRAVPFLRSDYCTDPEGMQCHTYGFNLWLPYYRGAFEKIDTYDFRSNISPLMMAVWDMRNKGLDYAHARKLIEQWRQVAPCLFGDFYPLTSYSTANNIWMAFQFDCPEQGNGMVQAFRRTKSEDANRSLCLRGLDPGAQYQITYLDIGKPIRMTGKELMENGLPIEIKAKPGAAVVVYRKTE